MKIFVIGGHKCGTTSLHEWFLSKNLKSIDGQFWAGKPNTSEFKKELVDNNDCFSDHFAEYNKGYIIRKLFKAYPDAYFILNYRDLESYCKSLLNHLLNNELENKNWRWSGNGSGFANRIINTHNTNQYALKYFKKYPKKLLVINVCNGKNIENTRKLEKFLNLPVEHDKNLGKIDHRLKPLDDPIIQEYYKKYKSEIDHEYSKIYKKISNKKYDLSKYDKK